MINPYETLGVPETATDEQIKSAYRRLAHKYHPDKTKGDEEAERKFKDVAYAYRILSDPGSRLLYDETGTPERPPVEREGRNVLNVAIRQALMNDMVEDAVKFVRDFIRNGENELDKKRVQFNSIKVKLQKKRRKIKTKSGGPENIFHMVIDAELDAIKKALGDIDWQFQVGAWCRKVLDDYEQEREVETPPWFRTTSRTTSEPDIGKMIEDQIREHFEQKYGPPPRIMFSFQDEETSEE